jgi:hypothetical protein
MAVRARHPISGWDVELEDRDGTSRRLTLEPEADRQPPILISSLGLASMGILS